LLFDQFTLPATEPRYRCNLAGPIEYLVWAIKTL
jgi:hypothetical protein